MPPIESNETENSIGAQLQVPAAPKNMSRNSIGTWLISVLVGLAAFLFGQNNTLRGEITGIWKEQAIQLKQNNDQLSIQLREAQTKLNNCEYARDNILQQYSLSSGKKTMIITPSTEGQNMNYEN